MNNIDLNKCYTLVAAGCSHTQGCAFTKFEKGDPGDWRGTNRKLIWANDRISDKLNIECTSEYITNNLTWMAFMRNHMNIGKIVNLGYGGLGTTSTVRSLQNYYINTPDLSNHLIVIQLQYNYRDELMIKYDSGRMVFETLHHFYSNNYPDNSGLSRMQKDYLFHLYDENFLMINYFYQLYFIQKLFERSGAEVRIFAKPWFTLPKLTPIEVEKLEKVYLNYRKVGWEKDLQGPVSILNLFENLNIVDTEGMTTILHEALGRKPKDEHIPTLHRDYGLEGDYHYSEDGNSMFASHLSKRINIKRDIKRTILSRQFL